MSDAPITAEKAQRNEFDERVYALADFANDGVDIEHPLTKRRLPVLRDCYQRFKFHTAVVIGGPDYMPREQDALEPEPFEVEQLCADLEYRMRYYNASYRRRVAARGPFDVDGTVNTHTFRKHPEHGWQYNVATWQYGPTWFPTPPWHEEGPFTLEALLDRVHTFGDGPPMPKWLEVKTDSGAFSSAMSTPTCERGIR